MQVMWGEYVGLKKTLFLTKAETLKKDKRGGAMKYTHESEELNALLGKKVKVTLFDDNGYINPRGVEARPLRSRRLFFS